jgi:predicted O-methyltransferase YrrM
MDPYFGHFLGLLRRSLSADGSEFGLGLTLFSLATSTRASQIIEIGRFKGFSTLALASALRLQDVGWTEPSQHLQRPDIDYAALAAPRQRKLLSIDPVLRPEAQAIIREAGLEQYVQFANYPSSAIQITGEADLIFIDGDHTYEGCRADVSHFVLKHLRPGGYFVLHDYFGWYDEGGRNNSPIKRVADEIALSGQFQTLLVDTTMMSLVICRKPHPLVGR